ncbi:xylulose kinase [Bacillus sp. ISL-35]|uniref:xylulokinase n=1 Tax=Bacillus sp. ISL-35 TaxID=2819122 RepID=UPI001BECBDF6|nr:FGGY family carbohydrate kinase [Bacillus sp. ISL-35]MBT2678704.1 xylulose kinase [Bacillus sp. ISL-35]
MSHVIGIDIGTSGIKVAAMNKEGEWGHLEFEPYSLLFPRNGWVEVDVNKLWAITKKLLLKVWNEVMKAGSVDAISLSSFCNSSVFMDQEGEALYPGIMYLDQRSKNEAAWIKETAGEDFLFNITGNRLEPGMYTATTHLWFKKHEPELYDRTYKWGSLSTFILHKLTGEFFMDWTHASFSGLFDIQSYRWSKEICGKIGIDMDTLPAVCDPSQVIGEFTCPELQVQVVPVAAGGADTACSALALGIQANEMFESVGTSNVLTVCTDNPSVLDNRFLNRCHIIKGKWLSHGAMSFPGASIQWFYEQFLKQEGYSKFALEELADESPIGSNGLFFLPYMQGERSPIWNPDARGSFVGLNLNSTKADMYRSILEGCSFGLKQIYEIINEKYKMPKAAIQSIGGGSKNRAWAQMKANILDNPFEIKDISETAALGACLIAGKAAGYFTTYEEARGIIRNETFVRIEPQHGQLAVYQKYYEVYCELYPALKSFFSMSSRLNQSREEVKC